jgi:transcriptional regulator with XRE-family HTH domain
MSDIAKTVGERLRTYRNRAGMTQEGLAERAGLHHTYIGQLERGEKNATLESIEKVARALGLPFEVLFEAIIEGNIDNATAKEVYELISIQSEKQQQALLDIIKKTVEYKDV